MKESLLQLIDIEIQGQVKGISPHPSLTRSENVKE